VHAGSSCRLIHQQLKILQGTLPDGDLVLKVYPSVFLVVRFVVCVEWAVGLRDAGMPVVSLYLLIDVEFVSCGLDRFDAW